MTFTFRPAIRENVGLWVNLIGGTGAGKSYTAMRLATGIAGGKPFAVIDTENRRALHYADQFKFDHAELRAPFRPDAYADAVTAADAAGYPVIVVDSGSHVWNGDGGVLDWQEDELDAMVKRARERNDSRQEWQIREAGKMSAWIAPKKAHKQMVSKLLQCRAHIILCLRAEQKIEMVKDGNKWVMQPKQSATGRDGWIPLCDKALPFEATCSFLLLEAKPGVPLPIKLQEQHRALFPLEKPITEESGRRIAEWASGAPKESAAPQAVESARTDAGLQPVSTPATAADFISPDAAIDIEDRLRDAGIDKARFLKAAKVSSIALLPASAYERSLAWIDAARNAKAAA